MVRWTYRSTAKRCPLQRPHRSTMMHKTIQTSLMNISRHRVMKLSRRAHMQQGGKSISSRHDNSHRLHFCSNNVHWTRPCLTLWVRVTHTCVGKLTILGWNDGLSPGRRHAIISTNARINGPLGTNFGEILIGIQIFSFKRMHSKSHWGHWWRRLQPTSSIITDAKSIDLNLVDFGRKTCLIQPGICS